MYTRAFEYEFPIFINKEIIDMINEQFNLGYHCTRKQVEQGLGERVALRWINPSFTHTDYTYTDLEKLSNRFANVLLELGIQPGERFCIFLPTAPELYFAVLGAFKAQVITCTLFSNFGEEALYSRLEDAGASIILTKKNFLKKIQSIWPGLPNLHKVLVTDLPDHESDKVLSYSRLMYSASEIYDIPLTGPDVPSVLHYTSGSTGKPKGVLHAHQSRLTQANTFHEILNVEDEDIYWCTADPAWVTGTTYGIICPLNAGVTQIQFGGRFDAKAWFEILHRNEVNIWYTAPTALRMLMQLENEFYAQFNLTKLRHIFSVGEPLNPEIIAWGKRVLHKDIYDTWFQTETGAIMIANRPGLPFKAGSMGKPIDEIRAAIINEAGLLAPTGEQGNLCLTPGWKSMFTTYFNADSAYQCKFKGDWYFSGDLAYQDQDGYYWFIGRTDDVINTAGHLVSPFEIESALLEIPEIIESGVIGAPDEVLWEKVIAYVKLKPGVIWTPDLEMKTRLHITNKVSTTATPREIIITSKIPKNRSGKIMRRILRAWYIGQDTGDISTLEE